MSAESHILNNFQSSIEDLEVDLQKMTELTINNLKASINGLIQRDSAACIRIIRFCHICHKCDNFVTFVTLSSRTYWNK